MPNNIKPMAPDQLAKGLIAKQGPEQAAKICVLLGRALIGDRKDQLNPNQGYYTNAFKYILKRFPKCIEKN